ncbi:patatin-like phospholipase family protein [Desulfatitalea alkaliphila]|uniref:Patatin-like phospholipase family protein n=1 Tax=Desulfatitalea alkaliphila TaxID=2929485 RepID=A0AA41UJC2_9BACT|nr:patatin-like phospholipase family protein [Desulfatitalea alkaliphila]MCJ8499231.1 patatin-like phospholipase family protein [Desulfatitalea alkaliphila]
MAIHASASVLDFYAGPKALTLLRDEGLRPDRIKVVAGAAGGPKGLVLHGLDLYLLDFFAGRTAPLFLLGASIGAWRFLSTILGAAALQRFTAAYTEQFYSRPPTPQEVSAQSRRILSGLMGHHAPAEALSHPYYRLSLLAVRGRHLVGDRRKPVLTMGLGGAVVANLAKRSALQYFFERTLFHDPRDTPPFWAMDDMPCRRVALCDANLLPATAASGAIPLLMDGVSDIPGAPVGTYWDGGIVDYHIDVDYLGGDADALVLYPHFTDRIIPGWLDKTLTWRKPRSPARDRLVVLAPSADFVAGLPLGKIPDRSDFQRFFGHDGQRLAYWRHVVEKSRLLAEAFHEATASGRIGALAKPLPC